MKLSDKVAVVTGATDGIGLAIALAFAKEGAKVVLLGRDEVKGKAALAKVKEYGEAVYFKADVSSSSQIKTVVEETIRRYGRIDVLVNNAGVVHAGTILTTTEETWDYLIDVNLKGVFLCCKYVIPHMQKQWKMRRPMTLRKEEYSCSRRRLHWTLQNPTSGQIVSFLVLCKQQC
jgi:hypothetical protein